MKTSFIPLDYDYFDFQGKNYARVIGRDSDNKRVCVIDSCPVYLWAILQDGISQTKINNLIKKISSIKLNVKGRKTKVEKVELHDKKFLGKKVKALKVFATNYKDLQDIAEHLRMDEIVKRRGYDLGYVRHYIIERKLEPLKWHEISGEILSNSAEFGGIDMGMDVDICFNLCDGTIKPSAKAKTFLPKVLSFDIETDELELGKGEILMISLVSQNYRKVLTWKKSVDTKHQSYVEFVEDEAQLLEKFVEEVRAFSPDFLVGYYSDGFDLPYIKARAEKFNVRLPLGLDGSQPKFTRGANLTGKIKGIVHIDILRFIRTAYAQYMKAETLSLNEVAKEFLGDTKKEFKIKHSSKLNPKDWEKYYEYNLHDSILTYQLFEKFWPDLLEFVKTIKEPIFDLSRAGLSKFVESYILHHLNQFNEIPEKRPGYNEIADRKQTGKVKGAFVLEPTPGIYENIAVFDFTSMHTSIIISKNISRETLLSKMEKQAFESPEIEIDGEKKRFYFTKTPGFFPTLLNAILEKRKKFKSEYKKNPNQITKARSNAFKVLSASAHGYVGFFGARYYSREASASILAFVREFNQEIIKRTSEAGFTVIHGDTDSVFFTTNGKNKKQVRNFLKKLNDTLPGVMELELEGFFKRGIWVTTRGGTTGAKKKYAMIDEKGELKIRGFETVRRDWCNLARQMQSNVIKQILKDGDEKKALEYFKEIVKKLKKRLIDKSDLIIRTQLKKPISEYKAISPHVVAAKKMKELEIPVSSGNLISYYIAEISSKTKLVRDKVKLPEEEGEYNLKYYLGNQILPSVENIFQIFGVNARDFVEDKRQEKLGKWF